VSSSEASQENRLRPTLGLEHVDWRVVKASPDPSLGLELAVDWEVVKTNPDKPWNWAGGETPTTQRRRVVEKLENGS